MTDRLLHQIKKNNALCMVIASLATLVVASISYTSDCTKESIINALNACEVKDLMQYSRQNDLFFVDTLYDFIADKESSQLDILLQEYVTKLGSDANMAINMLVEALTTNAQSVEHVAILTKIQKSLEGLKSSDIEQKCMAMLQTSIDYVQTSIDYVNSKLEMQDDILKAFVKNDLDALGTLSEKDPDLTTETVYGFFEGKNSDEIATVLEQNMSNAQPDTLLEMIKWITERAQTNEQVVVLQTMQESVEKLLKLPEQKLLKKACVAEFCRKMNDLNFEKVLENEEDPFYSSDESQEFSDENNSESDEEKKFSADVTDFIPSLNDEEKEFSADATKKSVSFKKTPEVLAKTMTFGKSNEQKNTKNLKTHPSILKPVKGGSTIGFEQGQDPINAFQEKRTEWAMEICEKLFDSKIDNKRTWEEIEQGIFETLQNRGRGLYQGDLSEELNNALDVLSEECSQNDLEYYTYIILKLCLKNNLCLRDNFMQQVFNKALKKQPPLEIGENALTSLQHEYYCARLISQYQEILKAENALDKDLLSALAQFDITLQKLRGGDVPAPTNVQSVDTDSLNNNNNQSVQTLSSLQMLQRLPVTQSPIMSQSIMSHSMMNSYLLLTGSALVLAGLISYWWYAKQVADKEQGDFETDIILSSPILV